jgi:hypothetical protein
MCLFLKTKFFLKNAEVFVDIFSAVIIEGLNSPRGCPPRGTSKTKEKHHEDEQGHRNFAQVPPPCAGYGVFA